MATDPPEATSPVTADAADTVDTTVTTTDTGGVSAISAKPPRLDGSWRWSAVGWYAVLSGLSLLVLFPIYMLLLRAVSDPLAYVAEGQPLYPVQPEWDVFVKAFTEATLGRSMLLSFVVTLVIVTAQLLTSVLAAYAFAFLEFPFKRLMFAIVVATLLLPIEVTLVANLQSIRDLGLLNSVPGLSLPFLATAFGVFLVRQGFMGIPGDLRDAATLDGYGHLRFLFRVAVPLTRPIIGSFVVISFLGAWNQYVWPRFATTETQWQTVQIALRSIASDRVDQLNVGFAAAVIAALPLVVLLILFQRQIVRGLTAGAVKG